MENLSAPDNLHILTEDLRFPEGPVVMPDGSIVVCELAGGAVSRVTQDGDVSVLAEVGGGPNGAALGSDGLLYICNSGGYKVRKNNKHYILLGEPPEDYRGGTIQRICPRSGTCETLCKSTDDILIHAPNDIVLDSHGGFYFTDFGKFFGSTVKLGSIFYARTDGSGIRRLVHPIQFPNGIGISPDGRTLFAAQTYSGVVVRWTIVEPGVIVRHRGEDGAETAAHSDRRPGSLVGASLARGEFDSLAIEADGSVCVATIDHPQGGITTFRPDGSVERLALPDTSVTNICFGGSDLRTAFITLSHRNALARLPWPRPGLRLNDH